ncbi:hypothetical protein CUZ91_1476 [Enterococcus xinjiangensis]|nr:hypothetical protein [Enterococcus lactis]MBL4990868.1 hypothetical protein [Enterococcus lactis]MBL5000419.1 hypothetical protein [Enterococcus lactis]
MKTSSPIRSFFTFSPSLLLYILIIEKNEQLCLRIIYHSSFNFVIFIEQLKKSLRQSS